MQTVWGARARARLMSNVSRCNRPSRVCFIFPFPSIRCQSNRVPRVFSAEAKMYVLRVVCAFSSYGRVFCTRRDFYSNIYAMSSEPPWCCDCCFYYNQCLWNTCLRKRRQKSSGNRPTQGKETLISFHVSVWVSRVFLVAPLSVPQNLSCVYSERARERDRRSECTLLRRIVHLIHVLFLHVFRGRARATPVAFARTIVFFLRSNSAGQQWTRRALVCCDGAPQPVTNGGDSAPDPF